MRDRAEVARWAHNPKVGGSIPSPATMKYPNATKHFYVSILKSTVRIGGYVLLPFDIIAATIVLIISELIGVIEEMV